MIIFVLLFWLSIAALAHANFSFPLLLSFLCKGKRWDCPPAPSGAAAPPIAIITPCHNEQGVIGEKLESIMASSYPQEKIHVFVGSDASTDRTDAIVRAYQQKMPHLHLEVFGGRTGKVPIMNQLTEMAMSRLQKMGEADPIVISTDANVRFDPEMIGRLVGHFEADPGIGMVAPAVLNIGDMEAGISGQEATHVGRENLMKYQEGLLWGAMAGAFGAAYALRASHAGKVPDHFLCDDFYLTYRVLEDGRKAITEPSAICYEDLPPEMKTEFRRKVRINKGNFQNTFRFWRMLLPIFPSSPGIAFSFLSHRVLRWCGPIFLLLMALSSLVLAINGSPFFALMLFGQIGAYSACLLEPMLGRRGIRIGPLRLARYFFAMNVAMLLGLWKFIFDDKRAPWIPTERTLETETG